MALTFTTGLTLIDDSDNSGSTDYQFFRNSGSGGTGSLAHDTSFFRQGTGSWGYRVQQNWEAGILFNTFAKAFGSKGANTVWNGTGQHLLFWYNALNVAFLDTDLNNGVFVVVTSDNVTGNSITNFGRYVIGGGPGSTYISYPGGWRLAFINLDYRPTNTVGTGFTLTSIRHVGIGINSITGTVKVENLYLDSLWHGTPNYKVVGDGTTVANWQSFIDHSDTNANGLFEDAGGAIFLSSGVQFGDSGQSATTTFNDATGKSLIFKKYDYYHPVAYPDQFSYRTTTATIDGTVFIRGTGSLTLFGVTAPIGNATYFGRFSPIPSPLTVNVTLAGATGVVVWEYWNGTSWTALSGVTDNTNSFKTTGTNTVVFTNPTDWAKTTIESRTITGDNQRSRSMYFIRARLTTQYTTSCSINSIGCPGLTEAINYGIYDITANGAAAQKTSITFGQVVGSGDDRQGVLGGSIAVGDNETVRWSLDFATNKTNLSAVKLYGLSLKGPTEFIKLENDGTGLETTCVSVQLLNVANVTLGTVGGGAEVLNSSVIDPMRTVGAAIVEPYCLDFTPVPSAGTLTHNVKNVNFITSGSPEWQYMVRFNHASDYSVNFSGMKLFGDYSGAEVWNGLNDGSNSDITISKLAGSTPVQSEFVSTASGTVTVTASYTLTLTNVPSGVNVTIVNSTTRAELQHSTSTGADITYVHGGGETVDILFMANDWDPNVSDIYDLTLPSADSSSKVQLIDDPNYENPP